MNKIEDKNAKEGTRKEINEGEKYEETAEEG